MFARGSHRIPGENMMMMMAYYDEDSKDGGETCAIPQ